MHFAQFPRIIAIFLFLNSKYINLCYFLGLSFMFHATCFIFEGDFARSNNHKLFEFPLNINMKQLNSKSIQVRVICWWYSSNLVRKYFSKSYMNKYKKRNLRENVQFFHENQNELGKWVCNECWNEKYFMPYNWTLNVEGIWLNSFVCKKKWFSPVKYVYGWIIILINLI